MEILKFIGTGKLGALLLRGRDGVVHNIARDSIVSGDTLEVRGGYVTDGRHATGYPDNSGPLTVNKNFKYVFGSGLFRVTGLK